MECNAVVSYTVPPEDNGATVRHILRARLHFSAHAISRLVRVPDGILVNGQPVHTPFILRTGDRLDVQTADHRPPSAVITPGPWPLPVLWEDEHMLVVNKPAGMTAHASNLDRKSVV